MNPLIELAITLAEKAIEFTVKTIADSAEHTAEEKAALIASINLRLAGAANKVAAVTFKEPG